MNTIQVYYNNPQKISRVLARMAVRALYFEVKSHPKPGLVSFQSNGAHADMNGTLFYRSLFSLRHYFYQLSIQDRRAQCFESAKNLAIKAEETMLGATNGINTHRGALFALGLICISCTRLATNKCDFTPIDLHHQLIHDWQETLARHSINHLSHGAQVEKKYNIVGARKMAMQGYEIIFHILDNFILLFNAMNSLDIACLYAYAKLLATIDDTNILYRKNLCGLNFAKQEATKILLIENIEERHKYALHVHNIFSEQQISPGGVGDLIAVLIFIGQLFNEKLRWHS